MSRTSSLSKNLFYNLGAPLLPFVVAAVSIPMLIRHIGTDRFGLLAIAWMVIGYFNLFDFGLGRSLTWHIADCIGAGRESAVGGLIRTALALMFGFSLIGSALIFVFTPEILHLLKVPAQLGEEARISFYLLGASIPMVILTSGLRGILEAYHRFDITNAIRTPQGLWTFIGPLGALPFSTHLDVIVAVLVVGRLATTIVYWLAVRRVIPAASEGGRLTLSSAKELVSYGGWTTLSNVLSPVMDYMDRFFISGVLGVAIVAFYTTPYEFVYRLNIISEGILGVLFPLTVHRVASDPAAGRQMLNLGGKLIAASVFPVVLVTVLSAHLFLRIWIGPIFEHKSSLVLQLLSIGLLINSLSKVPSNLIQAHGRSDITAKLHMIELPVYIFCMLWMLRNWGIDGAALSWTLRMLLDLGLLLWVTRKVSDVPALDVWAIGALCAFQLVVLVGAVFIGGNYWPVCYGIAALVVFALVFHRYVLLETERIQLRDLLSRIGWSLFRRREDSV